MQQPRKWPSGTLCALLFTFGVRSLAAPGRTPTSDVHLGFMQKQMITATPGPESALFYQQIPFPTTTDAPQLAMAMALVGTTTASVVSTTPLPIAPMPAVTVAPVAPVAPVAAAPAMP